MALLSFPELVSVEGWGSKTTPVPKLHVPQALPQLSPLSQLLAASPSSLPPFFPSLHFCIAPLCFQAHSPLSALLRLTPHPKSVPPFSSAGNAARLQPRDSINDASQGGILLDTAEPRKSGKAASKPLNHSKPTSGLSSAQMAT